MAWKSDRAGSKVASVKLASGDIDDDGFAELLVLAPYGRTGAQILSFAFGADGVGRRSVYRSKRAGFAVAGAQLTCADLDGDGKDDAILLGRSGQRTVLQGLRSDGGRLSRSYTWRGGLPAGSRLSAGHTRGKGGAEALVLRPLSAGRAAVERFTVRATGFAKTRVWSGRMAASGASLSCADVDGDGRSDLLAWRPGVRAAALCGSFSRGDPARSARRLEWHDGRLQPAPRERREPPGDPLR